MKSRFEDENLKWVPLLILLVVIFAVLLKTDKFGYEE